MLITSLFKVYFIKYLKRPDYLVTSLIKEYFVKYLKKKTYPTTTYEIFCEYMLY